YFLDNVTGWILELDRGKGIPYEGNYSSWLVQKQKRLEQEGREDVAHQKTLAREQEWIASSPKARQAKSKARYQRYEDLLKQASEKQASTAQITIPVAERLGQNVVDFEGLNKAFGDRMLIEDLTFKLPPGGIVGVIGPNGAGKTTLFRMITKQEKPDKGTIAIGESVHLGYVDQSRADINSHDRWSLDRIATHILAFEGDSHVEWFEGNFQNYEKDKMRRLGQDSIIPHRVKYKKLTR